MTSNSQHRAIPLQDASILATLAQVRSQLGNAIIPKTERALVDEMLAGIQAKSSKAVAEILVNGFANGATLNVKLKKGAHRQGPQKVALDLVNWAKRSDSLPTGFGLLSKSKSPLV